MMENRKSHKECLGNLRLFIRRKLLLCLNWNRKGSSRNYFRPGSEQAELFLRELQGQRSSDWINTDCVGPSLITAM
jgi:hypothetical protein